jgi:hypothetical protein
MANCALGMMTAVVLGRAVGVSASEVGVRYVNTLDDGLKAYKQAL